MPGPPNSTRTLLEQFFGRKILTTTQESVVVLPAIPDYVQVVPANPRRVKVEMSVAPNAGSAFWYAHDPQVLVAGGGLSNTELLVQGYNWIFDLDSVTLPVFAGYTGAAVTIMVLEVLLTGTLDS